MTTDSVMSIHNVSFGQVLESCTFLSNCNVICFVCFICTFQQINKKKKSEKVKIVAQCVNL